MNAADIAIVVVIIASVALGLWRGLITEVMSLVVWVAAVALALTFGGQVAQWFGNAIALPSARIALGHALVFIGTLMVGAVVVFLLRKLVEGTGLSGTDRMFGMVFGLVRGGAIVVLLVLLAGLTPFPGDPWWRESRLLPTFQRLATQAVPWLPAVLREHVTFSPTVPGAPSATAK
jgi:membrane protein required for colicin V production